MWNELWNELWKEFQNKFRHFIATGKSSDTVSQPGSDEPPPKSRKGDLGPIDRSGKLPGRSGIANPPHGKLAARFHHLVKPVVADQRAAAG